MVNDFDYLRTLQETEKERQRIAAERQSKEKAQQRIEKERQRIVTEQLKKGLEEQQRLGQTRPLKPTPEPKVLEVTPENRHLFEPVGIQTKKESYVLKTDYERIRGISPGLADTLKQKGISAYQSDVQRERRFQEAELTVKVQKAKQREKEIKEYKAAVAAFEKELKKSPRELQDAYKKDGIEGYKKAVKDYNARAVLEKAKFETELKKQPVELQRAYRRGGIREYNHAAEVYNHRIEMEKHKYDTAIKELEPFKKGENFNIVGYLAKSKDKDFEPSYDKDIFTDPAILVNKEKYKGVMKDKELKRRQQVLKDAGFKDEDIKSASYNARLNTVSKIWQGLTPWSEEKGEKVSLKGGFTMAAELVVPGVYTARHWKDLSGAEKGINILIDSLILVPAAKAAGVGARAVGTAGKGARVVAAGEAVGKEAAAVALAPINMIIHPIEAGKGALRSGREVLETLNPKKLGEAVITTSEGTVRLKVNQATSAAEAMVIRDQLMRLAARGERPIVKVGDQVIELAQSPLMKEAKGGLTHATPQGEMFTEGLTVAKKPGMKASEQGLFVSHEPLPRFVEASAFGKTGQKPVIYITSKETADQAVQTAKIYNSPVGKVAEMEKKFKVGTVLPKPAQKLYTRVGLNGTKVELWLEKPLAKTQILKLKTQGIASDIKSIWTEPIKIKGKGRIAGLTEAELKKLANVLKKSGNTNQARQLLRAERLSRSLRRVPPTLSRLTGRVSASQVRAARAKLRLERPTRTRVKVRELFRPARMEPARIGLVRLRVTDRQLRKLESLSRSLTRAERYVSKATKARITRTAARRAGRAGERTSRPSRGTARTGARREPRTPVRAEPFGKAKGQRRKGKINGKGKGKDWTPAEIKSAIAWRDGFVVHAIKAPYRRGVDEQTFHVDKLPSGLTVMRQFKGKGSQERSATVRGNVFPRKLTVDVGNQDVIITRDKGKLRLRHIRDTRGTTSRVTVKKPRGMNLSKRKGKLYYTKSGGGNIISRRPFRGY